MKSILSILTFTIAVFIFTGCMNKGHLLRYNDQYSYDKNVIEIKSKLDLEPNEQIAILLKEGSLILKDKGYEYFRTIDFPYYLTNFDSVVEYCYPKQYGLEDKCPRFDRGYIKMKLTGMKRHFKLPTWSIEQVLNDKQIQELTQDIKDKAVYVEMSEMRK